MLTCTELTPGPPRRSASVSRIMKALVLIFTQNSRAPRVLDDFEEVPAHQDFAAAEGEEKTPASAIWLITSLISAVVISP